MAPLVGSLKPTSTGAAPGVPESSSVTVDLNALSNSVESSEPGSKNDFPFVSAANLINFGSALSLIRIVWTVTDFWTKVGVTSLM